MTDFRALCAELLDALDSGIPTGRICMSPLANRTRAALAEQPVGPTDEELWEAYDQMDGVPDDWPWCRDYARAVLARWGQPAAAPVPVSERLPEPGEWVWHCYAGVRFWEHGRYNDRQFFIGDGPESKPATHWLPAHALPMLGDNA